MIIFLKLDQIPCLQLSSAREKFVKRISEIAAEIGRLDECASQMKDQATKQRKQSKHKRVPLSRLSLSSGSDDLVDMDEMSSVMHPAMVCVMECMKKLNGVDSKEGC